MRTPNQGRHPLVKEILGARITSPHGEQFLIQATTFGNVDGVGKLPVGWRRGEAVHEKRHGSSTVYGREERINASEHLGIVGKYEDAPRTELGDGTHNTRSDGGNQCGTVMKHGQPSELSQGKQRLHEPGTVFDDEVVDDDPSDDCLGVVPGEGSGGPFGGRASCDRGDAHDDQRALHNPEPTGGERRYFALFAVVPLAETLTAVLLPVDGRSASAFGPPAIQPA